MTLSLLKDHSLRGHTFEHTSRILLRRIKRNNFIFVCNSFDSINEIIHKYRLNCNQFQDLVNYVIKDKLRCDIIEFELNNVKNRLVTSINFYEVKTKIADSEYTHFDTCLSNHKFMMNIKKYGCRHFLIRIYMKENWEFKFKVIDYDSAEIRTYNSAHNHRNSRKKVKKRKK